MHGTQTAQFVHCGITVRNRNRVRDKTAFADFEFRFEYGWQRIGWQGG
jgi:hypothetical protein